MRIGILYNTVEKVERGFAADAISDNEIVHTVEHVVRALEDGNEVVPVRARPELLGKLRKGSFDILFNLCEGFMGKVQGEFWMAGYLELVGLPYTGSGPLSLGMCLNKMRTKQVLVANSIPTPRYQVFFATSQNLSPELKFPLFVKPIREDASVGISSESIVKNKLELFRRIDFVIANYDQPALVEEYIDGRELNVSVIGNGSRLEALPISEILFDLEDGAPRIVDYDSKWMEGTPSFEGTKGVCPADLPRDVEAKVKKTALEVFRIMGCSDYARVDLRLRDGVPYVLEVNPNPGINTDSGFARSAAAAGMDHGEMVRRLLSIALERHSIAPYRSEMEVIAEEGILIGIRPTYAHIDLMERWFNDPEVSRFMDSPKTVLGRDEMIEDMLLRNGTDVDMVILDRNAMTPMGWASLYSIRSDNRTGEVSNLIGNPAYRGRGLGKSIMRMLLGIAFDRKNLHSVHATVTERNTPSVRALRSCGFKEIGILREYHAIGEERHDEYVVQCLASDHREAGKGHSG